MKLDFNYEETLVLLRTLRSEYASLKAFYAENPDIEGMITPEEVRRVCNKILSEAHKEGDYTYSNKKCFLELNKSKKENIDLLGELKRRVNITYRTRINSTNRLREKHNEYKKLNIYYSALITGISILSIGIDTKIAKIPVSNIVLMFSIVLTYFMFYTSEQNLQERAYKMEETFKSLDKLKNKISIMLERNQSNITEEMCKKLYREYEAILASIENHEEIDYDIYRLSYFKKEGIKEEEKELYLEIKGRVEKYQMWKKTKMYIKYLIPMIAGIAVILTSILI